MILDEERRFFEQNKPELLLKYRNQYIKGSELIGAYPSAEAAYADGLQRFGIESFLVRQVLDEEILTVAPILSITRHAGL